MSETASAPDRVAAHTAASVNQRIRQQTDRSLRYHAAHPGQIDARLEELAREWDIERCLEANASAFALLGLGLGAAVDRRWLLLPAVVAGFLLQHSVSGWCPPLPLFRRLGVRTSAEILRERYTLRALRGDFDALCERPEPDARRVVEAFSE